ncbi:MAG: Ig-like domain-containing protein [Candidatus Thermoplasmatota archaeon]|nr:Ig-like domain-containing protein [Candidatus Thermoplasmatota archaeon]
MNEEYSRRKWLSLAALSIILLAGAMILVPGTANAESKPGGTLVNDAPARTYTSGWWWTTVPDELQFKVPSKTNHYTAVAIQNRASGEDFDLFMYSDYDMENRVASSTEGSNKIDLVVVDGHTYTGSYLYAKVVKFTGSNWDSGVRIESDYHTVADDLYGSDPDQDGHLKIGDRRYSLFEYHGTTTYSGTLRGDYPLVNMYDVYLDAGGYYEFDIYSVASGQDLSMYLFRGSGNAGDALVKDSATNGGDLSFSYEPESSGYYGLCVVDDNPTSGYSSSNNYTLLITSDMALSANPVSRLIAPGMNASYEIDVNSLGITKDIDLHYRWKNSGGTNISTPSGASASLSRLSVNAGGVGTEKVNLNITTSSSISAGTYFLEVYANDTGYNGVERSVGVVLRVSTNPDYFLTAEPALRILSPGSNVKYSVDMDTINNYNNNVTLSASVDSNNNMFNFTFNPSVISVSSQSSELTVKALTSTPVGLYNLSIRGSDGTLVRYANVTLRVKEPISIDIINPTSNELVSGVYTFRVSAGTPSDVRSIKMTFGGNMINAGTLNMFYNSANQFWERSVNTFTYVDGACTINITAEDYGAGLTTLGPVNFTLSNSAPNPIINTPLDRSYVTGKTMQISVNTTSYVIAVRFRVDTNAWTPMTRNGNTWTGTYDTTQITDGSHTLSVDAKDTAGMTGETSITIFVDNNMPTCDINSPIDGQYIEGTYTFRVVSTDTVAVDHVDIHIFGTVITLPYNPITSSYEYTVTTNTKPDGTYTVYATAYDKVNLSRTSDTVTFYIDNNAPSLGILKPNDNEIIGGDYTISVNSADIFLNSVKYRIDSTGWQNFSGSEPNWYSILNTSRLTDGTHTLTVSAIDNMSHLTEQVLTFIVDNTNPTCSMVSPFEGAFLEGVHTFKVSSIDTVGVDRVLLHVFSDEVQTSINRQTGYFEYALNTLTVDDGVYSVMATSYDLSGKWTNSSNISFKVDNNAPELTVHGLQNGNYVEGVVTFNLSVSDAFLQDVRYSIDGGGWIPINSSWDTTTILDGSHVIMFQARDQAGHSTTQTMTLIVDNNAPVCAVNGPVPNEFIKSAYRFRLSATDAVGIERVEINVFYNNFSAIFSSASGYYEFNSDTSIQPDGNYSCYAIAYDRSGKISQSPIIDFQVDNNAPVLRINHPLDNAYLQGIENMNVSVTDQFLDRVEYDVDGSGWVPITTPLNTSIFGDGKHVITFRAVDRIGHITTTVSDVIIDNTHPYGAISDPVADQFIMGVMTFRVVASDAVGVGSVIVDVFGSTLDMKYNLANGYYEYSTDTRLIDDGTYAMNITVTDLSGKVTLIGPHSFNLDNHVPTLSVMNLLDGDILEGIIELNITAEDRFLDLVQYQIDSTGWISAAQDLDTSTFGDGRHIIRVRATDKSGKEAILSFDVFFDNLDPTCTINSPVPGEFVEGTITIKVSAFDIVGIDHVIIKVYNLEARVPYNSVTGYYEYTSNTITWGSGEDGVRNVTAIAYDRTGKSYTYGPISFNVDNRAPTITINSPKEGQVISGLFYFDVINADVFKKGTDYNIDGASWQPVSIGWNTLLYEDGAHQVQIRATDLAGHVTMQGMTVFVDNNDPEISMITPFDNEFIEGTYIFRISAYDKVGIRSLTIDIAGSEKPLSYNAQTGYYEFLLDTRLLEDGVYTVQATIVDVALNTVQTPVVDFKVDNTYPMLTIESPVKDQLVSGEEFVIKAQTMDKFPGMVRYAIDGTTWYDVSTKWDTTKVTDGYHTVTVMTEDQAGHRTSFNVEVTVDNGDPIISQATITPGEVLSGTTTLRFYVYDSIGVRQVTLAIDEASGFEIYRGEGGLYYEYILNTRILADGDHELKLTATDRAGNDAATTYGIRIDNTGPAIELDYYWIERNMEVREGVVKEGESVIFVAHVLDPSGVGSVMINIDSLGWREMTPDSNTSNVDTYILYWPTSGGGSHIFQIRSVDKLGNENSVSGLIDVKKVESKPTFVERFVDALPVIWFLLILLLIIIIAVLAYTGVLTKWMKGEGMKKKEGGPDEGPEKKRPPFRNPFSKAKATDADNWEPAEETK